METAPTEVVEQTDSSPISPSEAAAALSNYRWKRDNPDSPAEEAAIPESGIPPLVAPAEEPPAAETAEPEPAEELPPIEAPRSWSKEWKEDFANYPREMQEKIAQREQERDTAIRRGQNEAAEQRKAAEAERTQLEQARKQYEDAAVNALQMLQQAQLSEFADIKTPADVERLAREDFPRYAVYDAKQKQIAMLEQQAKDAQQRQVQEYQTRWTKFAQEEDAKFIERAPEMANKEHAAKFSGEALEYLKDVGFSEADLQKLWNGEASAALRDSRVQLIVRDAVRFRSAQAKAKAAQVKPVPKVQRPGTVPARARDSEVQLKALNDRFNETGNPRDAAELLMARRGSR